MVTDPTSLAQTLAMRSAEVNADIRLLYSVLLAISIPLTILVAFRLAIHCWNRFMSRPKINVEIERKFLVKAGFAPKGEKVDFIAQGYLSDDPARTVRVRLLNSLGILTIKGAGSDSGMSRFEWEQHGISEADAKALLAICLAGKIEKVRHSIRVGKHSYEVDVFQGENFGLILAEIELKREDEVFERPEWLGKEVTGDPRYYNSHLAKHPFSTWEKEGSEESEGAAA